MDNIDLEVLHTAQQWHQDQHRVVLGTVIRTWGSAPRPIGSMVAIRGDGHVSGSVSGGCIEDHLIQKASDGSLPQRHPTVVTYGVSADEAERFGLPCGGTLQLVLEPVHDHSGLTLLLTAIARERLVNRRLDMASGHASLVPGNAAGFRFDGSTLETVHGATYRLMIVGAGQMSFYLATMAIPLGYEVTVCDPRESYNAEWHVPGTVLTTDMPDDVVLSMGVDSRTAIVALTHDPKLDDLALIDALQSNAFYVGAIGSRSNRLKRCERLKLFDVTDAQLSRLRCPVGLYVGAKTPAEIAVSILAEMMAMRYHIPVLQTHGLRERHTFTETPDIPATSDARGD